MTTKRVISPSTGPALIRQLVFNENSCSSKVSETGFNYFYSGGLLGPLNAAVKILPFRSILVVNVNAAVQYVALSTNAAMAAPASGADGIPVPPNGGSIILASGSNTYIRSSSADVFGFMAEDNIVSNG